MDIEPTPTDNLLNRLAIVFMIIGFLIVSLYYSILPPQIPFRFDFMGRPTGYAYKLWVWLLPGISIVVYEIFRRFRFRKQQLSDKQILEFILLISMLSWIKFLIMLLLSMLNWTIILIAIGNRKGLGSYFIPVTIGMFLGIICYFGYQINAHRKKW
ncbi:MAG: DUF1648 domain-containing protein [Saprospiraceae bacterium]|nr:DUF1648 domain-containing protein [Saprospiraceae bacterium]